MPGLNHSSATLELWELEIHMLKISYKVAESIKLYIILLSAWPTVRVQGMMAVIIIIIIISSEAVE